MADGMKDIIKRLEQQRVAIERALSALREVDGSFDTGAAVTVSAPVKKAKRKGGMTPEGRKRLSEALRRRWAAKRAAAGTTAATAKKATGKRRGRKAASGQ
jgi:hypothetical protein